MTLSAGDRLERYEILGPLGAGGMGEVYRTRDSELEREVAINVLPEAVANDEARVDGREVMRRRFRDDTLTLTVPVPLCLRLEREASNSVLQTPAWSELRSGSQRGSGGPED